MHINRKAIIEKNVDESSKSNFILNKVDLGPSTTERDFQNMEVTVAQMLQRVKKEKRSKEQLKEQVQMLVSFINSISDSSNAKVIVISPVLVGPNGILDHVVVERANKHKSHSMMIKAWINKMIEDALKLITRVKEIYGEAIKQVQEISKEVESSKEQKVTSQKIADELQEMAKLDTNTLVLEKIIADPSENQTYSWSKSLNWKMINISKGIIEFEKLIALWE